MPKPAGIPFSRLSPLLLMLLAAPTFSNALDQRFELAPEQLQSPPASGTAAATPATPASESRQKGVRQVKYTVQKGDHLFRILVHRFGVPERTAERLIPEIRRLNGIEQVRQLKPGTTITLLLPDGQAQAASTTGRKQHQSSRSKRQSAKAATQGTNVGLALHAATPAEQERTLLEGARLVWPQLVPGATRPTAVNLQQSQFSLTLDPERYPVLPAKDGATLLLDPAGTLPPLVAGLLQSQQPNLRIVPGHGDLRRFYADLLAAARFYSVEENWHARFGNDPTIDVETDFKVETTADSVQNQRITLLNVDPRRWSPPTGVRSLLNQHGFQLLEPYSLPAQSGNDNAGRVLPVNSTSLRLTEQLLSSAGQPLESDRVVTLEGLQQAGINFTMKADRYFVRDGQRYIVSQLDDNPVAYTLLRLLEREGYRVIFLRPDDNLAAVAARLMPALGQSGSYRSHIFQPAPGSGISLQVSGVMLQDGKGGKLFVTDRPLDQPSTELLELSGFRIR